MLKKCLCFLLLLLGICRIRGQVPNDTLLHNDLFRDSTSFKSRHIVANVDSLYIYPRLFNLYLQEGDTERAIFYGSRFKDEWQKRDLEKYESYFFIVNQLIKLYDLQGNKEKEIALLTELLNECAESYGKYNLIYRTALNNLATSQAELGNYSEAIRLGTEVLEIQRKVLPADHPDYALSLSNLAGYHYGLGNYDKAVCLGREALEIQRKVLDPRHPGYSTTLNNLADIYSKLGKYEEAISLGNEILEIEKETIGVDNQEYVHSLNKLVNYCNALGNYSEAIRVQTETLELLRKNSVKDELVYSSILHNLAWSHLEFGNYDIALQLETEALEIIKKINDVESPTYAKILSLLAIIRLNLGDFNEALRIGSDAFEIRKKVLNPEHSDYAISLNDLSTFNARLGKYSEAIRLGSEALNIYAKSSDPMRDEYAKCLGNLSKYFAIISNYSEAIRLASEALNIRKETFGPEHLVYAQALSDLSFIYSLFGNYAEAIHFSTEALEIQHKVLPADHPDYAKTLNNLACYYSHLGDYIKAIKLESEALEIEHKVLPADHPDYAMSLNNLSAYLAEFGDYSEAIKLESEALEIQHKVLPADHPDYALSLSNLAGYYSHLGDYIKAIKLESEALEIDKKKFGPNHRNYASSLSNLAGYYFELGNYTEAIRFGNEAIEILKNSIGTEHPDYIQPLVNLSFYYFIQGMPSKSFSLLSTALHLANHNILTSFSILSTNIRESFWSDRYSSLFNNIFPSIVFGHHSKESVSDLFDLSALFAKGILLNTGIEMRRLILESGDLQLLDKYDEMVANKRFYEKQLDYPISKRVVNMDSLRSVIDRQEMELARDSKAYGDFSRNLRIKWQEVQAKLDDDDIAIEFLDFSIYGTDSTMYVALSLRKGYDCPRMIPLFEKVQLDSLPDDRHYTSSSLYDLVWQPLEEELVGVKDIYFSPSGELHRIGIEYVPITETENICDRYRLHRLSSTRQLAFTGDNIEAERAVLYGGLDYEAETERKPLNTPSDNTRGFRLAPRANVDSLDVRGAVSYLPSTKEETDHIASDMKRYKVPYMSYSGRSGTEESFKSLDGTRLRILHIATHGFYLTEQEDKEQGFSRPMLHGTETVYREDKPMTRSGLLLSGCRPALNHEVVPEGVEDGILTAQEISRLDLRGLDLVVLSACQTGLGDITSGEGVFGLQRGFKNAGARTIVMSLWKVDDRATQKLMVIFYRNYLKGMDKEEAFRQAREELRRKNSSSRNRPDWAAFVMLDGCI